MAAILCRSSFASYDMKSEEVPTQTKPTIWGWGWKVCPQVGMESQEQT